MDRYELAIVGSGPCGASIAKRLAEIDRALLDRTIVIEKGRHPRPKVCGGAITLPGQLALRQLGFKLDMPHVRIDNVRLKFERQAIRYRLPGMAVVTCREDLDAGLARQAQARGMRLQEGCAVTGMARTEGGIRLETSQGPLEARAVVGADGSNSLVRRWMGLADGAQVCRLLKVLTPEDPAAAPAFVDKEILFDFSQVPDGTQGYYWEFPSLVKGKPFMNRGVLDARLRHDRPRCDLKGALRRSLDEAGRTLDEAQLTGAPVRWYDQSLPLSAPQVMLAGDAAGAEPLFAEGICFALEYGQLAAEELHQSFQRGDLSFSGWGARVRRASTGKQLHARAQVARFLYGQRSRLPFRVAWPVLNAVWATLGKLLFRVEALPPE